MSNVKVSLPQGGDSIDVADGGSINLGADVTLTVNGANVIITGLPTTDPGVAGALYANSNVLTLSTGS